MRGISRCGPGQAQQCGEIRPALDDAMTVFDAAPTLETDRLILRAHRLEDFPACAAMWGDPEVVRHITGTPFTSEASWARLLRYAGHWTMLGFGYWAIENKADGDFIGEAGFANHQRNIDLPPPHSPESGWALKTDAHGKGYATEAVARIVTWADRHLDCPDTFCIFAPEHAASIGVARKVGYGNDRTCTYRGKPTLVLTRPSP